MRRIYYNLQRNYGLPLVFHHSIASARGKFIYTPIPKNACSTIKRAVYSLDHGGYFSGNIHKHYWRDPGNYYTEAELRQHPYFSFAVLRDPISRFASCYRNRVLELDDLSATKRRLQDGGLTLKPDINEFVVNLEKYRQINSSIRHHTAPQTTFLPSDLSLYNRIYRLEELNEVEQLFRDNGTAVQFGREKSGETEMYSSQLSSDNVGVLRVFYAKDYAAFESNAKEPR